jgi:hypothetical protein
MADLSFAQGAEPVILVNEVSGNQATVNSDGSLNIQNNPSFKADLKQLYWCSYAFNLANSGEKMAMYFRNPSGSGKTIKIVDITLGLTNTVSAAAIARIYANPTVSANGTAQSALPAYIGGSQAAAVGLVTSGPTVSVNGSLYLAEQVVSSSLGFSVTVDFDECLILAANNSLLITGDPDGTNRNMLLTITWIEV